jgi:hypothetical protein
MVPNTLFPKGRCRLATSLLIRRPKFTQRSKSNVRFRSDDGEPGNNLRGRITRLRDNGRFVPARGPEVHMRADRLRGTKGAFTIDQ